MASNARSILSNIQSALQAINGSGGYHYDLSATGRVVVMRGLLPGMVPGVMIYPLSFGSEHGPQLGRYRRNLSVMVVGAVAGAADTPSDRAFAAFDLLDDITAALEADRTLGGTVLDVLVSNVVLTGDEADAPGLGGVFATVDVYYHVNSGTGV